MKLLALIATAFAFTGCVTHITAHTVKITVTAKTDLAVKGLPLP